MCPWTMGLLSPLCEIRVLRLCSLVSFPQDKFGTLKCTLTAFTSGSAAGRRGKFSRRPWATYRTWICTQHAAAAAAPGASPGRTLPSNSNLESKCKIYSLFRTRRATQTVSSLEAAQFQRLLSFTCRRPAARGHFPTAEKKEETGRTVPIVSTEGPSGIFLFRIHSTPHAALL